MEDSFVPDPIVGILAPLSDNPRSLQRLDPPRAFRRSWRPARRAVSRMGDKVPYLFDVLREELERALGH